MMKNSMDWMAVTAMLMFVACLGAQGTKAVGLKDIRDVFYPHYLEKKWTGGLTVKPAAVDQPSTVTV